MPVLSYIALPVSGAKDELLGVLNAKQFCEAFPADNEELVVLVTDTPDNDTEKELHGQLKNLTCMESLNLIFGYNEEQSLGEGDDYEDQ
jgi:nitrate reductase NapAB chaperone NapD